MIYGLLVITICLLLVINKHYIPNGVILLRNHFDYSYLNEPIMKIYLVKTYLLTDVIKFCGNYCSHWAIMIETTNGHHFIFSPSSSRNIYIYYIASSNIMNKYIRYNSNIPKWIITDSYEPINGSTVDELLDFMNDYVSSINYQLFTYNCQHIVTYCINAFCKDELQPVISNGSLCKEVIHECMTNKNIMHDLYIR